MPLQCDVKKLVIFHEILSIKKVEGINKSSKAARVEQKWKREQRQRMAREEEELEAIDDIELLEGKIKREKLKEKSFAFLGEDN